MPKINTSLNTLQQITKTKIQLAISNKQIQRECIIILFLKKSIKFAVDI